MLLHTGICRSRVYEVHACLVISVGHLLRSPCERCSSMIDFISRHVVRCDVCTWFTRIRFLALLGHVCVSPCVCCSRVFGFGFGHVLRCAVYSCLTRVWFIAQLGHVLLFAVCKIGYACFRSLDFVTCVHHHLVVGFIFFFGHLLRIAVLSCSYDSEVVPMSSSRVFLICDVAFVWCQCVSVVRACLSGAHGLCRSMGHVTDSLLVSSLK